jgi:uncharacterized protein (DUF58 family)
MNRRRLGIPHLTRRGFGTLFVGIGATGAGTALGVSEATTIGLLMLALWGVAAVHALVRCVIAPTVSVQRLIAGDSHLPFVGEDLTVDTVVLSRRRSGIGEITEVAVDDLSVRRGARSVRMAVRPLRKGDHANVNYRVTLRERGTLRFLTSTWRRQDPLGLFRWTFQLGEPTEITVGPAVIDLGTNGAALVEALRPHGGVRRQIGTDPFELRELRPYVTGDDLRRVHWASSARRNELIVREAEPIMAQRLLPLRIFIDARPAEHRGTLELALSIGASVIAVAEAPMVITIATETEVREHTSSDSALTMLATLPRERTTRRRSPKESDKPQPVVDSAAIIVAGPDSPVARMPGRAVLAAGRAPLDASAWEPGDATRTAVADAIVTTLAAAADQSQVEAAS